MKQKKATRKWLYWIVAVLVTPVVLFLLLAILIYLPPVQNAAVHYAAERLSASMGMRVSVERVRLAFPLDLAVHEVLAIDGRDTVLAAQSLRLDVRLLPLFKGRADIDGFNLYRAKVNTKSFIADTYIRGSMGYLEAKSHGVEWGTGQVHLDLAELRNANFYVALSDTAKEEEDTTAATLWVIDASRLTVKNTAVVLSLPGDTMRLMAKLGKAELLGGHFDTAKPYYGVNRLTVRDGALGYATRSGTSLSNTSSRDGNAAFWRSNDFLWQNFQPASGIDPSCIIADSLTLQIDSLSYDATGTLRASLKTLSLRERSGLIVKNMAGSVYMDSVRLSLPAFTFDTPYSQVAVATDVAFKALNAGSSDALTLHVDATVGAQDVRRLAQGYMPADMLNAWPNRSLKLQAKAMGNVSHLSLTDLTVGFPNALMLTLFGEGRDLLADTRNLSARYRLNAPNADFVQTFLPKASRGMFNIPHGTTASGRFTMNGNRYTTDSKLNVGKGTLDIKGAVDVNRETYDAKLQATAFPIGKILPNYGLNDFSGSVSARGANFDVLSSSSRLDAHANIKHFRYSDWDLGGLAFNAHSERGSVTADFSSTNALIEGNGTLTASLGRNIAAHLQADFPVIDIHTLGNLEDTVQIGTTVDLTFQSDANFKSYGVNGGFRNIHFMTPTRGIPAKDLNIVFTTSPDTTKVLVSAGDLSLTLGAKGQVDGLTGQFDRLLSALTQQVKAKSLDEEVLRRALPVVDLDLDAGRDNPLGRILYFKGFSYSAAHLCLRTNPQDGITGHFDIGTLKHGDLLLDTVRIQLYQDTTGIRLEGNIHNYTRQNPNKFDATLSAYLQSSELGAQLQFLDEQGRKGIDLGLRAGIENEGLRISLFPTNPVIAYRNFTVNSDNYIFLGKKQEIRADLNLLADDGTGLRLYGEPSDSANDLSLNVTSLKVGELCNVLPYLPRMSGTLNGDFHVIDDHVNKSLSTVAQISAEDFVYEGARVGNVGMEVIYLPKRGGEHYANAYISAEDTEVMQCEGTYYDEDGHFAGTATLHDCPLRLLNGFLAGTDIALDGNAGGDLALTGTLDAPVLNGALDLDSAHIYSDVYGFNFLMDDKPVEIKNSCLTLTDYGLYSATEENPLVLNGTLDFSDFSRMTMNFNMKATDFQVINAERNALSMVFGKVYANFIGSLRGTTDNISIRGKLEVLDRTDMTYVLKDSPLTVDDRLSDLVQFVDFSDTTTVVEEQAVAVGGFDLTLGITVSDAARFRCHLSEDGSNYVDLEGGGDLTMRITQQGDMQLTGRFTANSGEMKYSLPIIPLKTFNIVEGSYVEFTGDVMNPTLSIAAKERVKATVTENDQPRSVAFDVGVSITQPLNNMGLEFTIEAPEDLSVQNQLATMSIDQRSKAAVAMLATGMYVTDDLLSSGTSSGFKASNALNAFLQSEIENIAGAALKTIDLTVGMESGTSSTGTETTDYSFQFSKRFWNNRISVIIGGKVSTGQDAENSAESFIDNIAVEYRLDQSATRYVKVFYDRSTQDPLEGQLTRTGAGLVLKRKTDKLGDLFIFRKRKQGTEISQ